MTSHMKNPKLAEIALQVGGSHYPEVGGRLLEQFAEHVINICAKIADEEKSNSLGCGYITKTKGMLIKEHFGIK